VAFVLSYKVQYAPVRQRAVTATYACNQPLEPGNWIDVGGVYLIVERIVPRKPGDQHDGIALCKSALG
jgi:hypothetical protein